MFAPGPRADVPCLIIGAGPAGLATAACLRAANVGFALVDRAGEPGGAYREIYDGVTLASPATLGGLPGLALESQASHVDVPTYRAYLRRYAAHAALQVEAGEVRGVAREGGAFVVHLDAREVRARFVVVATGMWSAPVWPDVPGLRTAGIPALHARDWRGPGTAAAVSAPLLIVGGASSAVEIAEEAARAGLSVTVAARRRINMTAPTWLGLDVHHLVGPLERLPPWLATGYCARRPTLPGVDRGFSRLRAAGRIQVRPALERLESGGRARFVDGATATFGMVVAATGYAFATPFLPPEVARAPAGHVVARHAESVSWPGLFVVGAPCASRVDSEFLRGIARDAGLVARAVATRC